MAKKETEKESFLADSSPESKNEIFLKEDFNEETKESAEEITKEIKTNREGVSIEKLKKKETKKAEEVKKLKEAKPVFAKIPGAKTCPKCGSKRLTNTDGSFKCAIEDKNCSFIK